MNSDGKFNKNIVKRIYNMNSFYEQRWVKLINDSVESCKFEESKNLARSLAKFFECTNQYLEDNCINFVNTLECDKVQEHFESCNNVTADCNTWPENLLDPEFCCNTPRMFSQNSKHSVSCRRKCSAEELFIPRQIKCVESCLNVDTKLKVNGKFDFKVVKQLLLESTQKKDEWEKPISAAAEKCEGKLNGIVNL
jgi:hypothetical protein